MSPFSTLRRGKQLARISEDRKRSERALDELRPVIAARSGGRCEAMREGCTYLATEIHHRLPRSRGGVHDPANLLHVCWSCHRWIEKNRPAAIELGLLLSGYDLKVSPPAADPSPSDGDVEDGVGCATDFGSRRGES